MVRNMLYPGLLHLVNYNHREKGAGKSFVEREAPMVADPVSVQFQLPEKFEARSVRFLSPDADAGVPCLRRLRDRRMMRRGQCDAKWALLDLNQ